MLIPPKLKIGDNLRIISPSKSLSVVPDNFRKNAYNILTDLGLNISYSKNAFEIDSFESSSIASRISDINDAFLDKSIKGILTSCGGFNTNQLLKYIDFDLIKKNKKILCGFSDISVLLNAIYTKTGMITYYGPNFAVFGLKEKDNYTIDYFKKCVFENKPIDVKPSDYYYEESWYKKYYKKELYKNNGPIVINPGNMNGTIIGGNVGTFYLLNGTEYMPKFNNKILFLEDDQEGTDLSYNFDRHLVSLTQQKGFDKIKGIVIGRFENDSKITIDRLKQIIKTKEELKNIPIIANVDFGHTNPCFTFPIGGRCRITNDNDLKIKIIDH